MDISFEVLHAIPGRLRLRIPEMKGDAALADAIAQRFMEKNGVLEVSTNIHCASVVVAYDDAKIGTFLPASHLKGLKLRKSREKTELVFSKDSYSKKTAKSRIREIWDRFSSLIIPTVAMGASLAGRFLPVAPVYGIVAAAAAPVFARAGITIKREKRLGVDFLDATAIAIMGIQRNLPTCAFMAWLIGIGEHIREETARKSHKAIAELVEFNADFAIMLVGKKRLKVPASVLSPADRVVVNAGDIIPVDGCVVSGRAGIDQRSLTGEAGLMERSAGDRVYAGSIAIDGELVIEAEAVGLNTRAGKIVQMLRSAPMQETKIEDYAARFADRLVLPTFAASGAVLALSRSVARALSMLIVDFGTGVRVAAPTAFLSSMAYAAQRNIVIKGGRAMEKLASVDVVIFDKTGTLTTGTPEVRRVIPLDGRHTERSLLRLAAAAENGLNHPVANALVSKSLEMKIRLPHKMGARLRVGMGVKADICGRRIIVGSERLMLECGVDTAEAMDLACFWQETSESPLYVAANGKLIGVITYADRIRPESASVIGKLAKMGLDEVIMLTGDREAAARDVCHELGIRKYVSDVFPERKLEFVKKLRAKGHVVALVGDGINDSLALAHADVAIAPAEATDAAKEAADVLLMEDNLELLVEAIGIARSAMGLVRQNYKIVAFPNAGAIALAAGGLLGPPGATLINNGSTVVAGLNGLRPLFMKKSARKQTVCAALPNG